jgi:hypothetical protein
VSEQTACRINPRDIFTWWSDPPPAWPEAERRWLARLLADIGRISYLSVIGLMEEAILAVGIVELPLAWKLPFMPGCHGVTWSFTWHPTAAQN